MHSARARSCSTSSVETKPGASTMPLRPCSAIAASTAARSGPSPSTRARSPGTRARASPTAGTTAGARFSGMWRPANTATGSAGSGVRRPSGPEYSPSSTVTSPRTPSARSRAAVSWAKQNARCGTRRQSACTVQPMRPPAPPR